MRYFIEISYNGKAYHGWQIQPNAITVQEVLQNALSTLLGQQIEVVGAGRTDAGVHAKQLFAHFEIDTTFDIERLKYRLNAFLPIDVSVVSIFKVQPETHARFNALSRTYHYKIATIKTVFDYDYSYYLKQPLNIDLMNEACRILLEYKDFQCFSKVHTDVKTYLCDITEAHWQINENGLLFTITADRFLRNMVRAIVGTMVNIGLGKISLEDLHQIIVSKDRSNAGFSVPAHGLYLVKVEYQDNVIIKE